MYRQFARVCLAPIIGPIPEEARHPERIKRLLRELGNISPFESDLKRVSELSAEIATLDDGEQGEVARWRVGDAQVTCRRMARGIQEVSMFHLQCRRCVYNACAHTRALFFAFAWQDPEWREIFQTPAWEMMMEWTLTETSTRRRARRQEEEASVRASGPREGWVRYVVHAESGLAEEGLRFSMLLMRLSKTTGEPLKPMSAPTTWDEVEARVSGLTEVDRELFDLIDEIKVFDDARRQVPRISGQGMRRVRSRMVRRAVELLAQCQEVVLGEEPIRIDPTPIRPRVSLQPDGEGWELRLVPSVAMIWRIEPPHILTSDRVLRPVADEDLPLLDLARWGRMPTVPSRDLLRFLGQMAEAGIAVTLPDDADVARLDPPEARLYLEEANGDLALTARMAYVIDGEVALVPLEDRSEITMAETALGAVIVRRDVAFEEARRVEVEGLLNRGHYGLYRGEQAIEVLAEVLPGLTGTWSVYGRESLKNYNVLGHATPRVSFRSGIDWFDLDVTFEAGGVKVSRKQIIESWRTGKKYVRLKNGTIAWLQKEWLDRFGPAAMELDEIRRSRDGKVGLFAVGLLSPWLSDDGAAQEALAALKARESEAISRLQRIASSLESFDGLAERPLPVGIEADLRGYQRRGFSWLGFLRGLGLGGCLADDMGLGKTLQALTAIVEARLESAEPPGPSLVVAPTSVLWGWEREAQRFAPGLRVRVHHGTRRATEAATLQEADLVVTSYALLRLDEALLQEIPWLYVVLDEAQHIKNPMSQTAKVARGLPSQHRVALTGTPVENNLVELWSIFDFLMPGFFGSLPSFRRRYANPVQRDACAATLGALRRRIKPFVLRRLKREVATELPPRQEVVMYCELDTKERRLYERVRDTYRDEVRREVERHGIQGASIQVFEALTRLRQACCHPRLLPFDEARGVTHSSKVELLLEVLETTIAEGHRTLVFSQWPSLFEHIRPELEVRGWSYLQLDGSTTNRAEMVDAFNADDGPPVFLISLKAGGTGLNLTAADHVIHLDPWWNPAVEDQATDRAHRIGQTRPVTAWRLVARDTVEEKMLELQERKRQLVDAAINEGRLTGFELTREDLEAVFG